MNEGSKGSLSTAASSPECGLVEVHLREVMGNGIIESLRLMFMVNVDVKYHHVTPSVSEILTFCTPGTMFHRKCTPVSSSLVRQFLFNVS